MREVLEHNIQQKLSGTCQWIWSHAKITEWTSTTSSDPPDSRLLQLSGVPGCGKSILASSMVQSLRDKQQQVLYFSFSALDATRQTHNCLVRSFLWQMLQDSNCAKSFEVMRKLMLKNQPITSDLWTAFAEIIALKQQVPFWVIDGLDECRESGPEFVKLIKSQLQLHNTTRIAILGRPSSFSSVDSPAVMEIKPELTACDVDFYIQAEVEKSENLKSSTMQSLALEKLRESSHGMFLWVKFMISDLNKPASNAILKERLTKLPNGLKETYRHVLSSLLKEMDDIDRKTTKILLSLIVAARRPLELEELRYAQALAAWLDSKNSSSFRYVDHVVRNFSLQLTYLCKNLVYVSNGFVHLVHVSAREYLTRKESQWAHTDDKAVFCLRIDVLESQHLFSHVCIRYLSLDEYITPFTSEDPTGISKEFPLLDYASRNLAYHISQSEPRPEYLADEMFRFAASNRSLYWAQNYTTHLLLGNVHIDIQDLEAFLALLNHGDDRDLFLKGFQKAVEDGLVDRSAPFGKNNWRNDQLRVLLKILTEDSDSSSAHAETQFPLPELSLPDVQDMTQMLMRNKSLPVPKQLNLFYSLSYHLQKIKVLTDPLELLFRTILSKAAIIPAAVLLAIGTFYGYVGKHENALEVFRTAIPKTEPDSLCGSLIRLLIGTVMLECEPWTDAEHWFRELLLCWEKSFKGNELFPSMANCGLALSLYKQERYTEAEPIFRTALEGWRDMLGDDHASTLDCADMLGKTLHNQSKLPEAREKYLFVINGRKKALGSDHTDVLMCLNLLGDCYYDDGKYQKAVESYQLSFDGFERTKGKEHSSTLSAAYDLSIVLYKLEKYAEAEKLLEPMLKNKRIHVGTEKEDLKIFEYIAWLGYILFKQGKYDEAEAEIRLSLNGYERMKELNCIAAVSAMTQLVDILLYRQRYVEAENILAMEIQAQDVVNGMEHEYTLDAMSRLGLLRIKLGKHAEAEQVLRQVVERLRKVPGDQHAKTLFAVGDLKTALQQQGKFKEILELQPTDLADEVSGSSKDQSGEDTGSSGASDERPPSYYIPSVSTIN